MTSGEPQIKADVIRAGSGLGVGDDWSLALGSALDAALEPLHGEAPDLLFLFAHADYSDSYTELLGEAARRTHARQIVGCSASTVIAGNRELENAPGVAALALRLPTGARVSVHHVPPDARPRRRPAPNTPTDWPARLDLPPSACHGLIVLADPFTTDIDALVAGLERDYPGKPIMGGLATGSLAVQETFVFHDARVTDGGALVMALGGTVKLCPVVSQGCEPIGAAWTITDVDRNIVRSIGGRPAYELLVETVRALPPETRDRVNGNLLVGLAMDEYRDEFKRGDFLIRNLMGIDQASGAMAIAAEPQVGQTLQFQIRDAQAADEELRRMLLDVAGEKNAAAVLFACNGRGVGLFGAADHDARTVRELLGAVPLAGLFCNGEIGPVGASTFVHGFTASLALIAPAS